MTVPANRSVREYGNITDISDCPVRELGKVTVNGSLMDLRGLNANKPAADAVDPGVTYWSVDADPHGDAIEVSDGTTWTVI